MLIAQNRLIYIIFIAFAHLLNDLLQAVIPASYILNKNFNLTFTQIGLITLAYQLALYITALGWLYTSKRPNASNFGILFTLSGMYVLSQPLVLK
jgi:FSR family fosmidomycin resistance protein-like MFS transporter